MDEMTKAKELAKTRELAENVPETINVDNPTSAQMAELRQALQDMPGLVRQLGDLGNVLRSTMIRSMTGSPGLEMVVTAQLDQLAQDLGREVVSPLEQMLIDHVIVCYLHWLDVENRFASAMKGHPSLAQIQHWEKRLSATQSRYLKAVESLARTRVLLKRAPVQINIAQQQIVANQAPPQSGQ